jgi:pimeloyl-ACP methyl ester carboxylesterase
VLLVPGAAGSAAFWDPLIDRLPATWRVQAIDLPGLGDIAAKPEVASYDDLVDYVARSITTPAVVVAQSMGAFIALHLALRFPELVTHLVLVAATGGIDVASHGGADWRAEYATTYPHAQQWARARVADLGGQLAAIVIPVLLIWPTHDPLSPLNVAHALISKIPSTSLVTFPSDDHWIIRRFPDESADAIRSFVG